MTISYDAEIDALYIRLVEGEHQCRKPRIDFVGCTKQFDNNKNCQISKIGQFFLYFPFNLLFE